MRWSSGLIAFTALSTPCCAIQPGAASAQPAPLRDLEFGDINFLHTTDTHGWHAGHLLEPSFSADWGDYISFSHHLRQKLESEGKDLLLIDTGDRIEGNGLYDSSDPRGKYTFPIYKQQSIDLLCSGNHELYKNSSAEDEYTQLVPAYKDNYLATNLLIRAPKTGELKPLAPTHRKFTTKMGLRIMAFGFIFNFDRNDKNTEIIKVEDVVKLDWFQDAIRDKEIDLFIVIGHVAIRQMPGSAPDQSLEYEYVHKAIRKVNTKTPIQFFGGHLHIRDYRVFDSKSHALASGRFMETIGFQSISNVKTPDKVKFSRRYIDNNLYSLYHHSNKSESTFTIPKGKETSEMITRDRTALKLDETFGCALKPYWMARVPANSSDSIYTLLTEQIFPSIVNPARAGKTRMMLTNTGAIRFDIFAGPFTRDSTFIVSPFTSDLSFIADVPYKLAKQMLPALNNPNNTALEHMRTITFNQKFKYDLNQLHSPEQLGRQVKLAQSSQDGLASADEQHMNDSPLPITPGWTTSDDLGKDGDDTIHSTIPDCPVPKAVQALVRTIKGKQRLDSSHILGSVSDHQHGTIDLQLEDTHAPPADDEQVDLIFNQFLKPYILNQLNLLAHLDAHSDSPASLLKYEPYRTGASWQAIAQHQPNDLPRCVTRGECEDEPIPTHLRSLLQDTLAVADIEREGEAKIQAESWSPEDVQNYMPGETFTTLIAKWVKNNWALNCKKYKMRLQGGDGEL